MRKTVPKTQADKTTPKTILSSAANNYVPLTFCEKNSHKTHTEANIRHKLCSAEANPHMKNVSLLHIALASTQAVAVWSHR